MMQHISVGMIQCSEISFWYHPRAWKKQEWCQIIEFEQQAKLVEFYMETKYVAAMQRY